MFGSELWRNDVGLGAWEERTGDGTLEDLLTSRRVSSSVRGRDDPRETASAVHPKPSYGHASNNDGFRLESGCASPLFVTDWTSRTTSLTNAYVFVQQGRFTSRESLLPLVEKIAFSGRPLLVIADVDGDAMSMLLVNKLRGVIQLCVVKPPGLGDERAELLEDIAIAVGAHNLLPAFGRSVCSLALEELGRAEQVTVSQEHTVLLGGKGSKRDIRARVEHLQRQLVLESAPERVLALRSRLDRLDARVAATVVSRSPKNNDAAVVS